MRRSWIVLTLVALLAILAAAGAQVGAQQEVTFVAHLWGREVVPTNPTRATGVATFVVSADGNSIRYELTVNNLNNVQMGHIHLAAPGANGPIVVWLYPPAPPPVLRPGVFSGQLAGGTITAANLMGPLQGQPLSALITQMRNMNTYVNLHTTAFPAGEIRGQILLR
ncbi:MAG: CHRD domain-containing protein [Armatimonadota bacterium]|nr:CHRD domain-containing protein [Armatimonadota bacterium]MDR5697157.1 CHRD domain-containing protein [Armatimonadota bacterium]